MSMRSSRDGFYLTLGHVFLAFWFALFVMGVFAQFERGNIGTIFRFIPQEVFPLTTWLIYLVYLLILLFPRKHYFNGDFRNLLKHAFYMLTSPFRQFSVFLPFATDQFLSLTIPFRDFAFSACFSFHSLKGVSINEQTCASNEAIEISGFVFILVFILLRLTQCLNRIYHSSSRKEKITRGLQSLKYFFLMLIVICSMLFNYSKIKMVFFAIWLLMVVSAIFLVFIFEFKFDSGLMSAANMHGSVLI